MHKILIIEDDPHVNEVIARALTKAGYSCARAYSGTEGLLLIEKESFSLIVLDLMLPGISGEELLTKLREKHNTPVIVLSAKDSLDSKVGLLETGAEDYMTKPFEIKELLARIAVQIRLREGGKQEESEQLTYKAMRLDSGAFWAVVDDKELPLTRQEFKILELLLSKPDRVFSKQDIYDYAWDDIYIGEDKTINVHIGNIRKKIKAVTDEEYIETVWGVGFRLAK